MQGINHQGGVGIGNGSMSDVKSGRSFSTQQANNSMQIASPMAYQIQQHHHQAMMNQTQQAFARVTGQATMDMRATTANDGGMRNKDRMRNSQLQNQQA